MAVDPVTTLGLYAGKEVICKALGSAFEFISKKHGISQIAKLKTRYIDYCEKLLHIKTLAFPERSVFIDDIYVPLTLKGVSTVSLTVEDGTIFDVEGRAVLIKGLAGMGKSTILRKLLANNARADNRLSIFYELKNYSGGPIDAALAKSWTNVGITINPDQVKEILRDSNVKLYLDAFDESPPQHRKELLDELDRIINGLNCHLICTTRPDTEIDSVADFETYNVKVLSQSQIFGIIEKTSADEEKAKSLCEALEKSPLHKDSDSILKSPILVVLFCISYNLGEDIPSTLSQFYENIFDTIFFRHDNLKGKVNRERYWNDNRRIYKALFEYLCFISQRSKVASFSRERLVGFMADSLRYMNEDESVADKITDELTSITNLIIEDGYNEYRFIHKSIQEFFSSALVRSLKQEQKYGFYKRCWSNPSFHALFSNTLFFLEEIDYYDYAERYLISGVSDLLDLNKEEIQDTFLPSKSLINDFIKSVWIQAKRVEYHDKKLKISGVEEELSSPFIASAKDMTETRIKLYMQAIVIAPGYLQLGSQSRKITNYIVKHGEELTHGTYKTSYEKIFKEFKVNHKQVQDLLGISIDTLFTKAYNNAVVKLRNRTKQTEHQGYLDFD